MSTSSLSYRKAQVADLPFLLKLRKATMEEHLRASGIFLTEEEHIQRIEYEFETAYIILWRGMDIGLLKTKEKEEEIEIIQMQIEPFCQGKGLGQEVISTLLEQISYSDSYLSLQVLKGNKAKRMYERLGFIVTGETEDSYMMSTRHTKN